MRKLGINTGSVPGVDAFHGLAYIKNAGFDSFFTGYKNDELVALIAEEGAKLGLDYETIHAPFKGINNIWFDGEEGDEVLKTLTTCLESCANHGIPTMIVHLSSGNNAPAINDIGHARFDSLVDLAVKKNVTVAFENQRKLANLAFVMELYKDIEQVGFCWDNGHEACFALGKEFMPFFGERLVALHIHDNLRKYNEDMHLLPFDGILDFHRFGEHIRNSGYTGTLMLEALPKQTNYYDGMSPEEYYEKAYKAVSRLRLIVDGE